MSYHNPSIVIMLLAVPTHRMSQYCKNGSIKLLNISSCGIFCFEIDPSTKHLESFKVYSHLKSIQYDGGLPQNPQNI